MKGFLGKIFGGKKEESNSDTAVDLIGDVLENLISLSQFNLGFDIKQKDGADDILVEIYGEDEELVLAKEGQLLDAMQLYIKRVLQHQVSERRVNVSIDCSGFREQANQSLIDLAEKLKGVTLEKGKPVYFRALPPRDRKVIHQYLAGDERVKSRSVGDGLYKKIKIYPIKGGAEASSQEHALS